LHDIARREDITVDELCTALNAEKPRDLPLTVAIRIGVLRYYADAATEAGHTRAGHGGLRRNAGKPPVHPLDPVSYLRRLLRGQPK
jgi:predicted DNA-binding ribbon-helix-helix protein